MTTFDPAGFELAHKGNKFADFEVGAVYDHHWGRTFNDSDNSLFSTITCAWLPLYLNREYAEHDGHSDVVLNPMLVLCTAVGISVEDLSEAGGPFLGVDNCEFHQPVFPGDTITARSTVLDTRSSNSRPDYGIVSWRTDVHNQHGNRVASYERTNLVAR